MQCHVAFPPWLGKRTGASLLALSSAEAGASSSGGPMFRLAQPSRPKETVPTSVEMKPIVKSLCWVNLATAVPCQDGSCDEAVLLQKLKGKGHGASMVEQRMGQGKGYGHRAGLAREVVNLLEEQEAMLGGEEQEKEGEEEAEEVDTYEATEKGKPGPEEQCMIDKGNGKGKSDQCQKIYQCGVDFKAKGWGRGRLQECINKVVNAPAPPAPPPPPAVKVDTYKATEKGKPGPEEQCMIDKGKGKRKSDQCQKIYQCGVDFKAKGWGRGWLQECIDKVVNGDRRTPVKVENSPDSKATNEATDKGKGNNGGDSKAPAPPPPPAEVDKDGRKGHGKYTKWKKGQSRGDSKAPAPPPPPAEVDWRMGRKGHGKYTKWMKAHGKGLLEEQAEIGDQDEVSAEQDTQ